MAHDKTIRLIIGVIIVIIALPGISMLAVMLTMFGTVLWLMVMVGFLFRTLVLFFGLYLIYESFKKK